MVSILVVSHSRDFAKAAVELVSEMKSEKYLLEWMGGIEDGKEFGSDPMEIQLKMQELNKGDGVLLVCDMGSSVMNSQLAKSFLSDEEQKQIFISKGPFFEGLLSAVVTNRPGITAEQLYEAANSALGVKKY